MEVTYTLTNNDLFAYYAYALRKARKLPPNYGVIFGCLMFVVGLRGLWNSIMGHYGTVEIVSIVFILWSCSVVWNYSRFGLVRTIKLQAKRNPSLFAKHHVKIDPAWLYSSSVYDQTQMRWQMVSAVDSNSRYIYITAGNTAYILAKTCFGSMEEAQQFLSLATHYWQQAKSRPDLTQSSEGVWPPAPRTQ